jgi:AcrR family transcriptional regulator
VAGTRERILEAALDLFAERGYAGTSVADLAKQLGITKAALYYHFASKSDILAALIEAPVAEFHDLAAAAHLRPVPDLLTDISDITADMYTVSRLIGDDPSVRQTLRGRSQEINDALTAALAEGGRSTVRAHAAYAAIKNGTLAVMAATGAKPTSAERAELVAAALRALG